MVLSEHGFGNVPIYAPNQDDRLYRELDIVGGRFMRLGWRAILATDFLVKMLHQTRPYERVPGETDRVYAEQLSRIGAAIEKGGDAVFPALSEAVQTFLAIPKTGEQKPVVGIVGEIYIRSNRFGNSDLVRRVEEFGGEAWLAPITEWITYVNYTGKKKIHDQGGLPGLFQIMLTDYIQKKDEHRVEKIFEHYLRQWQEPRIKYVLNQATPYLDENFEGEAILTIGKSIDFIRKGASGIINSMPFTCMPGTVSSAIMSMIQNKYSVPVLNVAYDGQGDSNTTTRLEAFMHQVNDYFQD
jgi:predicted nucleotide-binding protein (sugar kinase/HSP70/actin superfamily)